MINKITFPTPVSYRHVMNSKINAIRFQRESTGNQVVLYEGEPIDMVLSYDNKIKQLILQDTDLATEDKLLKLTKQLIGYAGDSAVLIDSSGEMELFNSQKLSEFVTGNSFV